MKLKIVDEKQLKTLGTPVYLRDLKDDLQEEYRSKLPKKYLKLEDDEAVDFIVGFYTAYNQIALVR